MFLGEGEGASVVGSLGGLGGSVSETIVVIACRPTSLFFPRVRTQR